MTGVVKCRDWRSVPLGVLEDHQIDVAARLVLAWALAHGNGWVFRVGHMRRMLGIGDERWARARNQLIQNGYLEVTSTRGEDGRVAWTFTFTDEPLPPSPDFPSPGNPGMGSPAPENPKSTRSRNSKNSTTTTRSGIDLDELFEASALAEKAAGRPVRNPARFKMALRSRLESDGPNESDFENLATLRRVREREASQRKPEPASEIAKKTKKPPLPRAP